MAKIVLTIEADDAADLRLTIEELAGYGEREQVTLGEADFVENESQEEERPTASATQDAEPQERQKRTRRTKLEMMAERAGVTQAAPKDAFSADVEQARAEVAAETVGVTLQDVRQALQDHMSAPNRSAGSASAILKQFINAEGKPSVRVSELKVEDYPAAIEALRT